MPWKRNRGGGYRTRRGGNIKHPTQYEGLRRRGYGKRRAAAISNRRRK